MLHDNECVQYVIKATGKFIMMRKGERKTRGVGGDDGDDVAFVSH